MILNIHIYTGNKQIPVYINMIHAIKYHDNPFKIAFSLFPPHYRAYSAVQINGTTSEFIEIDADRNLTFIAHPAPLLTRVHNLWYMKPCAGMETSSLSQQKKKEREFKTL